jgi:hypothetical protein
MLEAFVDRVESLHHPDFHAAESTIHLCESAIHVVAEFRELSVDAREPSVDAREALGDRLMEGCKARKDLRVGHATIVRHRLCPAISTM